MLQDQQYQTSRLPGHPRQLVQPCGTIIPILQAHRDVATVLALPEPDASALPAPSCLRWVTPMAGAPCLLCQPRSGRKAARCCRQQVWGPSFFGKVSLSRCLSERCFPVGKAETVLTLREQHCETLHGRRSHTRTAQSLRLPQGVSHASSQQTSLHMHMQSHFVLLNP